MNRSRKESLVAKMKASKSVLLGFVLMLLIVPMVDLTFADVGGTVTIAAGDSFVKKAVPQGTLEVVKTSYNASGLIHFVLINPSGTAIHDDFNAIGLWIDHLSSDTYTWKWENTGSSFVTLSYTITHADEAQETANGTLNLWLIGGIVAAVIIVIVIAFALFGRKKH